MFYSVHRVYLNENCAKGEASMKIGRVQGLFASCLNLQQIFQFILFSVWRVSIWARIYGTAVIGKKSPLQCTGTAFHTTLISHSLPWPQTFIHKSEYIGSLYSTLQCLKIFFHDLLPRICIARGNVSQGADCRSKPPLFTPVRTQLRCTYNVYPLLKTHKKSLHRAGYNICILK